jgi:hypothetical protein
MRRMDRMRVCAAALTAVLGCGDSGTASESTGDSTGKPSTTSDGMTTDLSTTDTPTTVTPTTGTQTSDVSGTGSSSTGEPDTTATTASTGPLCDDSVECGGQCVDVGTDPDHCGGCDMPCGIDEQCVDGACMSTCPGGQMMCDDVCVDPQSDPDHCGGCGMPCEPGEVCNQGTCAADCDAGLEVCAGACVDTQTDLAHCGGCDMPCAGCQLCDTGMCTAPAAPPAPGPIAGETMTCANATLPYSIPKVDGAVSYTWTVPAGASVTMGQDTEAVTVEFGATEGQVCVTYNDGCAESAPSCVDIELTGGAPGMQVFNYTGGAQEFTVPACVSTVTVELFGAQGGGAKCCDNTIQDDGGKGGYVKASLDAVPGAKWGVYVGGKGATEGGAGWNGGGTGGQWGAGGGGGSDLRIGGAMLMNRVLVAGGGGGGNCGCPEHGAGGAGGALIGDPGDSQGGGFNPGGGGTQVGGGAGGSNPGAIGQNGLGGGTNNNDTYHIGAGGGGWFGGGGAYASGGGGGSSYHGNAMNASTQKGLRSGDGEIRVSW